MKNRPSVTKFTLMSGGEGWMEKSTGRGPWLLAYQGTSTFKFPGAVNESLVC